MIFPRMQGSSSAEISKMIYCTLATLFHNCIVLAEERVWWRGTRTAKHKASYYQKLLRNSTSRLRPGQECKAPSWRRRHGLRHNRTPPRKSIVFIVFLVRLFPIAWYQLCLLHQVGAECKEDLLHLLHQAEIFPDYRTRHFPCHMILIKWRVAWSFLKTISEPLDWWRILVILINNWAFFDANLNYRTCFLDFVLRR